MVNQYVWIGIAVVVFVAGIGTGFAALQGMTPGSGPMNFGNMSPQEMQQAMQNPDFRENMLNEFRNNPKHMNQMAMPMMETMMNDSQMRGQMMDMMLKHPDMMSSIKQHKPMMNHMMGGQGMMMNKGNNMMINDGDNTTGNPQLPTAMKQQTRNQVGIMLQDPELKQQMRESILQNMDPSDTSIATSGNEILATGKSSDGTVSVEVKSSTPMPGKFLEIIETFHDGDGNILEHVNHSIHVTQDDQTVLKMSDLHSHHGEITYYTRELQSDSPVEIEILMNGIGMEEPLTGPTNETITVKVSN